MAKLKNPLLSLKASGSLGRVITFVNRRLTNIVEKKPVVPDAQTTVQLQWRHMFNKCVDLWHLLSAAEKDEWESAARSRHMTGYAWYISQCLRPNPGIYLPLQGGTMSGDIDMGKYQLLRLPAPTDDQEPARKAELDAHTAIANAHHSALSAITFVIDGGGSAITTGEKGHLEVPFICTIEQATMLADQSGSIVVDIWKDTYANFPPTNADSITAATPPTITAALKSQDATLTGWTKSLAKGDILAFNVDSCTTITRVTVSLRVAKA